jgi:hypothetical protein
MYLYRDLDLGIRMALDHPLTLIASMHYLALSEGEC